MERCVCVISCPPSARRSSCGTRDTASRRRRARPRAARRAPWRTPGGKGLVPGRWCGIAPAGRSTSVDRLARVRAHLEVQVVLVVARAHVGLGHVDRVAHDRHERQDVAVADEMLGHRGAIAAGDAVAADPAFLQVRRRDGEDVAFPLAGGEAHRRVHGVGAGVRPAVHPDRALGAPREVVDLDGDELLRVPVALFPDADRREAGRVVGGVDAALVLGQRDERRVPGVGAEPHGVGDRDAGVVAELGARQTVGFVLVEDEEVVPDA